jgi:isopentenyl-diphosphate delta-isomerase
MGFEVDLEEKFHFVYKAEFDNGLTEHELDHVMVGYYNEEPIINLEEVASWRWIDMEVLQKDMKDNPQDYTAWFKIIFDRFVEFLTKQS